MRHHLIIVLVTALVVGGGMYMWAQKKITAVDTATPPVVQTPTPTPTPTDPYSGWQTISIADALEIKIPPGEKTSGAAGSMILYHPTPTNETPLPDMNVSTDGAQFHFRRWENLDWEYWDKVIASIHVKTPLTHPVQINIQK